MTAVKGPAAYWAKMSPEERSAEMKKRAAKGRRKKARKLKSVYGCSHCEKVFTSPYKLANHVRYDHPKGKKAKHGSKSIEALVTFHEAYVFGKVETLIEHYADSAGVSRSALALGVASLIRHKEGGKVLGA